MALRAIKSPEQSQDLVQEVFLKLWAIRSEWAEIEHIEAWLFRVMGNKLIDHLRKVAADNRLKASLWQRSSSASNDTAADLDARESGAIIRQAIAKLPPQRRTIFLLNREAGLSYQEIADELLLSRHTVKNQLSNALHFLRRFVGGK